MAHSLDEKAFVGRLDPKNMYGLTVDFPRQCRRAYEISSSAEIGLGSWMPGNIVLTGLGGSAVGGDLTRCLMEAHGHLPFIVNRDYTLPAFVGSETLVFATSFSGNTEETLSAYLDAKKRGATVICVTSGGKLAELAQLEGDTLITIPGGQPPRTALGYMCIPVIVALERTKLIHEQPHEATYALLDSCVENWGVDAPFESNPAKQLAMRLHGVISVLYGLGGWQGAVANRWKGQINENSKNMTFANAFPELNHNEILGWVKSDAQGVEKWLAIILEDGTESAKMNARASVTSDLIASKAEIHRVHAEGSSLMERIFSLTFLGDFVSLYLAALNEVDPENIDSINILKAELSKIPSN